MFFIRAFSRLLNPVRSSVYKIMSLISFNTFVLMPVIKIAARLHIAIGKILIKI